MQIYLLTNTINGKKYVGQTTYTAEKRFKGHKSDKTFIGKAVRKYGAKNFKLEVLLECASVGQLNSAEQFYIAKLGSLSPAGYNLDSGGKNKKLHETTKTKISQSRKLYKWMPIDCQIARRATGEYRLRVVLNKERVCVGNYRTVRLAYKAYRKLKRGAFNTKKQPQINFSSASGLYRLREPGASPRKYLGTFKTRHDAYKHYWKAC